MAMTFEDFYASVERTGPSNLNTKEKTINAVMGISGEAGEISELFKKHFFHGLQLDGFKVQDELGDLMFYIQWLHNILGLSLEQTMYLNKMKLEKRYPNGFEKGGGIR